MKPCALSFTINMPSDEGKVSEYILVFGIFAIVVMLCTFDMDYQELWQNLRKAGMWFPAVILLWVFIYYLNAWSWYVIIRDWKHARVSFWKVYKLTISGLP